MSEIYKFIEDQIPKSTKKKIIIRYMYLCVAKQAGPLVFKLFFRECASVTCFLSFQSLSIQIGCLQGTYLGPLLYIIAANDLSCHIPSEITGFRLTTVRYADDVQLVITGPRSRLAEMEYCLEHVLDTRCTWFLQNGMKVNVTKTEMLMCGDCRQLAQIPRPACVTF